MLTQIFGRHYSPKCVVQIVKQLLLLRHLQSLLCTIIQKRSVTSQRHLNGSLGGSLVVYGSLTPAQADVRQVFVVVDEHRANEH